MSGLRGIGVRLFLAFGLSFIFWVFVWLSEGGRSTYRNIPVDIDALSADLVIVDDDGMALSQSTLPGVNVSVEASAETLASFDKNDLRTFVNLDNINAGDHEIRVRATLQKDYANLSIVDIEPQTIDLRIERLITTTVPLTVEVQGNPPHSYESSSPDILATQVRSQEPSQVLQSVQVVGPENRIADVVLAFAAVNIEEKIRTLESSLQLEPRDRQGNVVEGVSLVPEQVFVRVPIYPVVGLRRVPVVGDVIGQPAPGYVVTGIESDPTVINLSGNSRQLDKVNQVRTRPVNITAATRTITDAVDLIFPAGTQPQSELTEAVITVSIQPQTMTFTSTLYFTVEVTGTAEGFIAEYDPLVLPISVTGLPRALDHARQGDLNAVVDVRGLETGEYFLKPQLSFSDSISVTGDIPDVRVSLLLPNTPTPRPTPTVAVEPTHTPSATPSPSATPQEPTTTPTPSDDEREPVATPALPIDESKTPTLLPTDDPTPTLPTLTPPDISTSTATSTALPTAASPPMPFGTTVPTMTNPLDLVESPDDPLSSLDRLFRAQAHSLEHVQMRAESVASSTREKSFASVKAHQYGR